MRLQTISIALLCSSLVMQTYGQQLPSEYIDSGQFTKLLESVPDNFPQSGKAQILASYYSFMGRTDLGAGLTELASARICSAGNAREQAGVSWILEQAKNARVIMFNENHLTLASRIYVRSLLPQLKELGYSQIGFEALEPFADNLDIETVIAAGYYTIEPAFAALMRDAAGLGYQIFGYENTEMAPANASMSEEIDVREQGQTLNIIERLNAAPADAKFVIYAGWSHIAEEPLPDSGPDGKQRWMASVFREQTGLDPLTIELTGCAFEANDTGAMPGKIFFDDNGRPQIQGQYADAVDAQIYLPVASPSVNVSSFYRSYLGVPVQIPDSLRSVAVDVLVQAYRVGRREGAVADDRILLRSGEDMPLYLQSGDYQMKSWLGDGSLFAEQMVRVE